MEQHIQLLITLVITVACFQFPVITNGAPAVEPIHHNGLINKEVAYLSETSSTDNDAEVEELHSLDPTARHHQSKGKLLGTLTEPHNNNEEEKRSSHMLATSIARDTPRDMAEYIFWTGEENDVTSAIKDFVTQGLMTAKEGSDFLDEVHSNLFQLRLQYGAEKQIGNSLGLNSAQEADGGKPHQGNIVVTSYENKPVDSNASELQEDRLEEEIKFTAAADAREELAEDMQLADLLANEYSLEEVISQLVKIIFSQSHSTAGHPETGEALRKFADFLEKESKEGKLSPQMQKKVLDVLLASLFDTLGTEQDVDHSPNSALALQSNSTGDEH